MSPRSRENYFSQLEEESEDDLEVILQQVHMASQFLASHLQQLEHRRKIAEAEIFSLRNDIDDILQSTALLRQDNLIMELESERLDQEIEVLVRNVELHCFNNFHRSE